MRRINEQDTDAIFDLCQLLKEENARMSFTDIEDKQQIKQWLDDPAIFLFGAFDDNGKLKGLLKATRGKDNKTHSVYLAAATHPAYRKKHVAENLTLFALESLKNEGIKIARTYIYSGNTASIATIEKCGFTQSGRVVMHEFDEVTQSYIDDLIYYKLL